MLSYKLPAQDEYVESATDEALASQVELLGKKLESLTSVTIENIKLKNTVAALTSEIHKLKSEIGNKNYLWKKKCFRREKVIKKLKQDMIRNNSKPICSTAENINSELVDRIVARSTGQRLTRKYGMGVRKFSVTVHYYSPNAYRFVRAQLGNCLPHERTLGKWYSSVNGEPGFTQEAVNVLSLKVRQTAEIDKNKKIICSLVFDEMAVRQQIEYDGSRYHGYVDMGACIDFSDKEEAKEALVFMLVAINDTWKLPVGYFFINGLTSEQKASLVTQCPTLVKECGIIVANVTFDGCPANFSMASKLGCILKLQNLKTTFGEDNISILPDPSHMCKLVRNTFGEKRKFIDSSNEIIDFKYVELLNDLQETEGLHLANKLRRKHIMFFKQKMKVKLATQLLSRSVAEALLYCKDELKLQQFAGCEATIRFILLMNDAFDILNSRNMSQYGFKKALTDSNISKTKEFYEHFKNYVSGLLFLDLQPVLTSKRKTGFLGFIIALESTLKIFDKFVTQEKILCFLPVFKCSQDHLERFFGMVRLQCGCNNNPTCRVFRSAYKKILIHNEVRDRGIGNCIPLEQIHILNCSSASPSESCINVENIIYHNEIPIGNYSGSNAVEPSQCPNFLTPYTLSNFSEEIVTYIAGFVALKLSKSLKCEDCVATLVGDKENLMGSCKAPD